MVDVGPLTPITCPNGCACPHDLESHRYDPARQRWTCTVEDCPENPERVITIWPTSLTYASYSRLVESVREQHGPDIQIKIGEYPTIGTEDIAHRWWRRRR